MKLRFSNELPESEERRDPAALEKLRARAKPILVHDLLQTWADRVRREIDTEVTVVSNLGLETAVSLPEADFVFLLTLLYRFCALSGKIGDPAVVADLRGGDVTLALTAKKTQPGRPSAGDLLGIPDYYRRLLEGELSACGVAWSSEQTTDEFSLVLTIPKVKGDVSYLLAPTPDEIARAVREALRQADTLRLRFR